MSMGVTHCQTDRHRAFVLGMLRCLFWVAIILGTMHLWQSTMIFVVGTCNCIIYLKQEVFQSHLRLMIIRRNSMHCSLLSFLLEGKDDFCRVTAVSGLDCTWFSTSLNPCPSHILWCIEESLQGLSAFQQNLVHIHRSDHHALRIIIGMKGNDLDHLTTLVLLTKQRDLCKQFTILSCEETSEVRVTIGHNV